MPTLTVRIPATPRIFRIIGFIMTRRRKTGVAGSKRKAVFSDIDEAVLDTGTNKWVLSINKPEGTRNRRNFVYIVAYDRRGRVIDQLVRRCRA